MSINSETTAQAVSRGIITDTAVVFYGGQGHANNGEQGHVISGPFVSRSSVTGPGGITTVTVCFSDGHADVATNLLQVDTQAEQARFLDAA